MGDEGRRERQIGLLFGSRANLQPVQPVTRNVHAVVLRSNVVALAWIGEIWAQPRPPPLPPPPPSLCLPFVRCSCTSALLRGNLPESSHRPKYFLVVAGGRARRPIPRPPFQDVDFFMQDLFVERRHYDILGRTNCYFEV